MTDAVAIQDRLELLRAVPSRIAAVTSGASDGVPHRRTDAEPWSVNDVLAHVRASADNRVRFMCRMASGEPTKLAYVSPRAELKKTDYMDRPFAENLAAFTADRVALVDWLSTLPVDAWDREVSIRDRPETVATYARYLTADDVAHSDQIETLLR
jgi:mycothiol maleylpyruvate isomerase-like protein